LYICIYNCSRSDAATTGAAGEDAEILKILAIWKMRLVLPAAWASNFFYTYQFQQCQMLGSTGTASGDSSTCA